MINSLILRFYYVCYFCVSCMDVVYNLYFLLLFFFFIDKELKYLLICYIFLVGMYILYMLNFKILCRCYFVIFVKFDEIIILCSLNIERYVFKNVIREL